LERTIRHTKGCPKMRARRRPSRLRSDGDLPWWTQRQFSVRRELVAEVRRSLANYQKLKGAIGHL
jgi:hypothetical protein